MNLDSVVGGFADALMLTNVLFVLIGVSIGTIVGLLPGLGGATGIALLLPLTIGMDPLPALIMLAGIYYGVQYGGSITSILVATPGEASTVMTTLDGYALARKGRAGAAIAMAAIASFIAGTVTIVLLMGLAPLLARLASNFGPPENFALIVFALVSIGGLATANRAKGLAMAALGVALSTVGLDPQTGTARFTFGSLDLLGGIRFIAVVIGLFAVAEVMNQLNTGGSAPIRTRFKDMLVTRDDWRHSRVPIFRQSLLGFAIGVLPGAGATVASFIGYDVERRFSPRGNKFGTGVMEGVAAPEAANNAAANGAFVPTLTLGIPGSAATAILLGAFLVQGISPGPLLFTEHSGLVWGLMASFYIGNVALLLLNLPLAPLFAALLRLRYVLIYPVILVAAFVGAYAEGASVWDMWVVLAFGVLGYGMKRLSYPAAPLVLGLILGGLLEQSLVQSSSMGSGDLSILITRPISLALIVLTVAIGAVHPAVRWIRARR